MLFHQENAITCKSAFVMEIRDLKYELAEHPDYLSNLASSPTTKLQNISDQIKRWYFTGLQEIHCSDGIMAAGLFFE